jgi:hypothetical protein
VPSLCGMTTAVSASRTVKFLVRASEEAANTDVKYNTVTTHAAAGIRGLQARTASGTISRSR